MVGDRPSNMRVMFKWICHSYMVHIMILIMVFLNVIDMWFIVISSLWLYHGQCLKGWLWWLINGDEVWLIMFSRTKEDAFSVNWHSVLGCFPLISQRHIHGRFPGIPALQPFMPLQASLESLSNRFLQEFPSLRFQYELHSLARINPSHWSHWKISDFVGTAFAWNVQIDHT